MSIAMKIWVLRSDYPCDVPKGSILELEGTLVHQEAAIHGQADTICANGVVPFPHLTRDFSSPHSSLNGLDAICFEV